MKDEGASWDTSMKQGDEFYWITYMRYGIYSPFISKMVYIRETPDYVIAIEESTLLSHEKTLKHLEEKGTLKENTTAFSLVTKSDYVRIPKRETFERTSERDALYKNFLDIVTVRNRLNNSISDLLKMWPKERS